MECVQKWLLRRWYGPSIFGNVVITAFVLTQVLDGLFTYWGVSVGGLEVEANPIVRWAMAAVGVALGLTLAKLVVIGLGTFLYLRQVHKLVAILTAFYVIFVVFPWAYLFLVI